MACSLAHFCIYSNLEEGYVYLAIKLRFVLCVNLSECNIACLAVCRFIKYKPMCMLESQIVLLTLI